VSSWGFLGLVIGCFYHYTVSGKCQLGYIVAISAVHVDLVCAIGMRSCCKTRRVDEHSVIISFIAVLLVIVYLRVNIAEVLF